MNEMTISVSDLLGGLIRKGKSVLLSVIVFAILLGALKVLLLWKNMNNPEYLDEEKAAYEQEVRVLEHTIETASRHIAQKQEYLDNSLWMQINPYDKHVAGNYLTISGIDEKSIDMTFGNTTTPADYITGQITAQYQLLWAALDLPSALGLPRYEAVADKYVRELVSVSFPGAGTIAIHAIGSSAAEAQELVDAVSALLQSKQRTVAGNSFQHTITPFESMQQNQIDPDMANAQIAHQEQIDDYNGTIMTAKLELAELDEPDSIPVAVIKMFLLGGVLGGVLACVWLCCKNLMQGLLQSSSQAERTLRIPFIASVTAHKGLFARLADTISVERVWKSEEQAVGYISEVLKNRTAGKKLLLVSTLELDAHGDTVKKLQQALSAAGTDVTFAGDFFHDPKAVALLKECDAVVLVECVDRSKLSEAGELLRYAEEYSKSVAGLVLV